MKNKLKLLFLGSFLLSTNVFAESDKKTSEEMVFSDEIWLINQENPLAQFYIAEKYYLDGKKDKALDWYLKSANQGFISADTNATLMIENKVGLDSNMDQVVNFLSQKGLKGDLFSQMYLGDIYRNGEYHKDYEKSYYWYSEAAKQGQDRAEYYIGNMSISGVGTFKNVPKGIRYLEKMADKGHTGAMYNLGKIHKIGFNIGKNHVKASEWFKMAAEEGHVDSMFEIADSLERGLGVDKDDKKALEWFETAALHGHVESSYRAGMLNLFLSVISDDYSLEKAIEWLSLASDEGHIDAQVRLGDLYYEGKYGIVKDYIKADKYYTLAANNGDKLAWKKKSMIYRLGGHGVERSKDKYEIAIKKFYTDKEEVSITKETDKLKLFNYNIFEY